jgi:hypothetical protein
MKGGLVVIFPEHIDRVKVAILKFQQEVTDPKAMILPTYNTVADIVRVPVPIPCWPHPLSDTRSIG